MLGTDPQEEEQHNRRSTNKSSNHPATLSTQLLPRNFPAFFRGTPPPAMIRGTPPPPPIRGTPTIRKQEICLQTFLPTRSRLCPTNDESEPDKTPAFSTAMKPSTKPAGTARPASPTSPAPRSPPTRTRCSSLFCAGYGLDGPAAPRRDRNPLARTRYTAGKNCARSS